MFKSSEGAKKKLAGHEQNYSQEASISILAFHGAVQKLGQILLQSTVKA
jgi:hypothetical protein